MVGQRYLLDKPRPPSPVKLLVDQSVVPALIDAAAAVEMRFERLAARARRAPLICVGMAFGIGWLASRALRSAR